jgi:hypothetical protein
VASEGRSEQAVAVLTTRELMELDDRDTIFFYKNLKPGRGLRLEYWGFPLLEKRRAMPPPPVKELPPVSGLALPGSDGPSGRSRAWRSAGNNLRFPIDPDDLN